MSDWKHSNFTTLEYFKGSQQDSIGSGDKDNWTNINKFPWCHQATVNLNSNNLFELPLNSSTNICHCCHFSVTSACLPWAIRARTPCSPSTTASCLSIWRKTASLRTCRRSAALSSMRPSWCIRRSPSTSCPRPSSSITPSTCEISPICSRYRDSCLTHWPLGDFNEILDK